MNVLKIEALDVKIGLDTAENKPRKGSEKRVLWRTPFFVKAARPALDRWIPIKIFKLKFIIESNFPKSFLLRSLPVC